MEIKYFIAYTWEKKDSRFGKSHGTDRIDVDCARPIGSMGDIEELEEAIAATHFDAGTKIIITGWQRFEHESEVA